MKKVNGLFIFLFFLTLLSTFTIEAKAEGKNEIKLIDIGNGIMVPESFEVKNAEGEFLDMPELNMDDFRAREMENDGKYYETKLDNGYTVEVNWLPEDGTENMGARTVAVYNDDDELMFYIGWSWGWIVCSMRDEEGNQFQNQYKFTKEDPSYSAIANSNLARMRATYDVETNIRNEYLRMEDAFYLEKKYDYNEDVCTLYSPYYAYMDKDKPVEDSEMYSYKKEDLVDYRLQTAWGVVGSDALGYGYMFFELPSKIIKDGVTQYAYKLAYTLEPDVIYGDKPDPMAGKKVEHMLYFTEEQIKVLESENIIWEDEVWAKHPEFIQPKLRTFVEEEVLYDDPNQKAEDEIIRGEIPEKEEAETATTESDATDNGEEYTGGYTYQTGSDSTFMQELTGDVVPINGKIPVMLFTHVEQTPAGEQIYMDLLDANYTTLCSMSVFDLEHTKYHYVYLTMFNDSSSFKTFSIAGTDSPVSGNLSYAGVAETFNGETTEEGAVYANENY